MNDFLKDAKNRATETVEINGAKAMVRGLSAKELDDISGPYRQDKTMDPNALTYLLIVACLVDDKGKPIMASLEEAQEISPGARQMIGEAIARVNGFKLPN